MNRAARIFAALCLAGSLLVSQATQLCAQDLPRTIVALYDSPVETRMHSSRVHRYAAMPLNHLGLVVEFHDIAGPLPDLAKRPDVRGLLFWHPPGRSSNPLRVLDYLESAVDANKRAVVLEKLPDVDASGKPLPPERLARLSAKLGWRDEGDVQLVTYDATYIARDPTLVDFERKLPDSPPPFSFPRPVDSDAILPLRIRNRDGRTATPIIIGRKGSIVSTGFVMFIDPESNRVQWHVNPFELFRRAFATDDLPKPDTTTLAGRRIYYSHIDGDGWLNLTQVRPFNKDKATAIDVLIAKAIAPYPDLPVSVAPVAAELDPEWIGNEAAQAAARRVFALPQVEAASHSYSHPFRWGFFENYKAELEKAQDSSSGWFRIKRKYSGHADGATVDPNAEKKPTPPRAYQTQPFDLTREIGGSLDFIGRFAPSDRQPRLIQWPGDNLVFPEAIKAVRARGAVAINGGDTRFDEDFPSNAYVAPIGFPTPSGPRIYASASNENTYTSLWTEKFFAFGLLPETWARTEAPRRTKPMNLYYHAYTGERTASLNALIKNLEAARSSEIIPILTSNYAEIAEGFFSARISAEPDGRYRVRDRGALQTIRFDNASSRYIDLAQSQGVTGFRHHQGSLYVALDAEIKEPVIAFGSGGSDAPSLVQSRWQVRELNRTEKGIRFTAQGFSDGVMQWRMPPGRWTIRALPPSPASPIEFQASTGPDGLLELHLPALTNTPVRITVERERP